MLSLASISLFQFKNYTNRSFDIGNRVIAICGSNGAGKTTLLDAVHYLCFTKSYFTRSDANVVQQGKTGFRVEGRLISRDQPEKAVCILRETGKKEFSVNGEVYEKFSQHIGRYPCVVIAPDDAVLITGGSEERRKFLDSLLCQLNPDYLQHLISYSRLLQQRNALLKSFAESGSRNFSLLDVLDQQLARSGNVIFDIRKEFMVAFLPAVRHLYEEIARQHEDVTLLYESELLGASFESLLQATRQKDCLAQRTTAGIHRDDIVVQFGSHLFRNIASQGQRKSLLFALKLAEMEILKREKGFAPLLLLDDVFEKLDDQRTANLLQKVCVENEGQVFITDTSRERLCGCLDRLKVGYDVIVL
ncbi:MAG: DNA replication and repair protein RecF [Chitinophagaceae bacterium]